MITQVRNKWSYVSCMQDHKLSNIQYIQMYFFSQKHPNVKMPSTTLEKCFSLISFVQKGEICGKSLILGSIKKYKNRISIKKGRVQNLQKGSKGKCMGHLNWTNNLLRWVKDNLGSLSYPIILSPYIKGSKL